MRLVVSDTQSEFMTVNAGSKDEAKVVAGSDEEEVQPQTVSYETYQKVLDQRKADRQKARDLQTALDAANAEKATAEETRLANDKKFEELYTKEKADRIKAQETLQHMTVKQVETTKREAIKTALGGVRKADYTKFFDLSLVVLSDDGEAEPESVKAAANKFRESYPELVAGKAPSKMAHEAGSAMTKPVPKPLHTLPPEQLRAQLAALNTKK